MKPDISSKSFNKTDKNNLGLTNFIVKVNESG